MDIVCIKQLTVLTTIGIYDWEQAIRQPLVIDLQLGCDLQQAAQQDNIDGTVSYATVSSVVTRYLQQGCFALLERVAEEVAALLLEQFALCWVAITVTKPGAVANAQAVGVSLERGERRPNKADKNGTVRLSPTLLSTVATESRA